MNLIQAEIQLKTDDEDPKVSVINSSESASFFQNKSSFVFD